MNKIDINVPEGIRYLSNWKDFGNYLPKGKAIINKSICGCGCTEYFLTSDTPTILVSPRLELINCKMNSERLFNLHYFDRRDYKKTPVEKTIKKLVDYLKNCQIYGRIPKVIVTNDSAPMVVKTIESLGVLSGFDIIVDEFTCIFTDSKFKGSKELFFLRTLNQLHTINNIYYISATPVDEETLMLVGEFNNVPYITLNWTGPWIGKTNIVRRKMRSSTFDTVSEIISNFKQNGYFLSKTVNGQEIFSTEAVFFINDVRTIVNIIECEELGLTTENTRVICANDKKNRKKLKGVGFEIGHLPNKSNYKTNNKTYTFVTRASFEGADFYSDCSTTYIFADSNRDNMCLDISIDLPQIIGRCRLATNPFRRDIQYYYKSNTDTYRVDDLMEKVESRMKETKNLLKYLQGIKQENDMEQYNKLAKKINSAQSREKYVSDYTEAIFDSYQNYSITCNMLAYAADLRAIKIKEDQYSSEYTVMIALIDQGFTVSESSQKDTRLANFQREVISLEKSEQKLLKKYCEFIASFPELKSKVDELSEIPLKIKEIYNTLGPDKCKALKYQIGDLNKSLIDATSINENWEKIKEEIGKQISIGQFYYNKDIKVVIAKALVAVGVKKTVKAKDILDYFPSSESKQVRVGNERCWGYVVRG